MIIFIFTMKCPLFGGCHTVTSIIYINLLEDIATTPTRRGDSSVRGASGRCHAIGMAAGPGEFPGASKTYAISCGWRLVPTPWAKTRQKKKGRSLFHWSCGLRIDPMMKSNESCFFFLKFHMEHGYYIADSYWKGKGAVFFPNVNMHFV